ncbi:MAG TPA: hypothetical protein VMU71_04155 [Terracidiphilus sp.]|nr:hypothetical protein [Terracidiphilus sp.]
MTGIELIAIERKRQMVAAGEASGQDDDQAHGELALAAVCYATPVPLYVKSEHAAGLNFEDPWPPGWDGGLDRRFSYGERRDDGKSRLPHPASYSHEERLDLLIKAGTLIAAEIDRLQQLCQSKPRGFSQRLLFFCDLSTPRER